MDHLCIVCQRPVTRRQKAFLCDGTCERWQHRLCGIPVDQTTYRRIVRGECEFSWHCQDCSRDDLNETVAYEEPMQVPEEPEDLSMLRPEEVEAEIQEDSLMDETLLQEHIADQPATYQVIERGSQRETIACGYSWVNY